MFSGNCSFPQSYVIVSHMIFTSFRRSECSRVLVEGFSEFLAINYKALNAVQVSAFIVKQVFKKL